MPEDFHQPPPPAAYTPPAAPAQPAPYPYAAPAPYPYPARPQRSGWFWFGIITGSLAIVACLLGAIVWAAMKSVSGDSTTSTAFATSQVAVVDIDGVILDADKVDTQIRKFADDSSVKAIILHINSPGGGAAASQEIYNEVLRIRHDSHKPIVASVESVGASGAYYIASACDKIYANQASVVGSIGVIMEWTNYGPRKGLAALFSGDADSLFPNPTQLLDRAPGFYFMWR